MSAYEARWPLARFTTAPPPVETVWHPCTGLNGDDHASDVRITYFRYGRWHSTASCGVCEPSDLEDLHYGNPQPEDVEVCRLVQQVSDEQEGRAAA